MVVECTELRGMGRTAKVCIPAHGSTAVRCL
jgi:hypothetical protein